MINCVNLTGRLTKEAELKFLPNGGTAVSNFTLAVDRNFKDKITGQRQADFIPIVLFGKGAEALSPYFIKGALIGVTGRIQVRSYENKEGKKVYVTEVIANDISLLGGKGDSQQNPSQNNPSGGNNDITPIDDDLIPF